jgi:PPOX class probable F420-dependent enzyme
MNAASGLAGLGDQRYLNLETYRKNGQPVRTPVWFASAPGAVSGVGAPTLYVYTMANAGKAKRIRRTGASKVAACNARGGLTGPWIDTHAEIVVGEEFARGMRLINRKYRPWKQILDLSVLLFRRHERVVLAIRPA